MAARKLKGMKADLSQTGQMLYPMGLFPSYCWFYPFRQWLREFRILTSV